MTDAAPGSGGPAGARPVWQTPLGAWNALVFAAWIVVPFGLAGLGWLPGWVHLGALAAGQLASGAWVRRRQPELVARRRRIGEGTRRWDLAWNTLYWPLMAAIAVVAALQAQLAGPALPLALVPVGVALLWASFALSALAMASNPFFEGTVRIQKEVGQRVVEAGPYRRVRHPGYAALVLWALSTPLVLRSTWAFAAAVAAAGWIVLRTMLEDRTLRRELEGYADYARRVRWRLVPGLW